VFYCLQSHMKLFRGQGLSHLTACAASLTCLRPSDSVSTRLIFNLTSSDIGSHELELELIHVACHGYQGRAPRARHGMEVEPSSPPSAPPWPQVEIPRGLPWLPGRAPSHAPRHGSRGTAPARAPPWPRAEVLNYSSPLFSATASHHEWNLEVEVA
jgi:hypothetical protein